MPIHILHITDLHLSASQSWDQEVLLQALLSDLERLRYTHAAPELVVFSGDLANAASDEGIYGHAAKYLTAVLNALGLDESKAIICAGNHDADRSAIVANLPKLAQWRQQGATLGGANSLVEDDGFKAYTKRVFGSFEDLRQTFGATYLLKSTPLWASYFFRDLGVAIATINTAALSGAGLEGFGDQGQLVVAERTLIEASASVAEGVPILFVGHHPASWLNEVSSNLFDTIISRRGVGYFNGHLHAAVPRHTVTMNGAILNSQSGALYSSRSYWNGYGLVSVDVSRRYGRIAFRRWYEQRREFSKAEDLGDDGIFYTSDEARVFFSAVTPSVDPISLERWRVSTLVPHVLKEADSTLTGQQLETIFVEPQFDREVPYAKETETRVGSRLERLSFGDLAGGAENFIVSASAETGKSTLLKMLALTRARQPATTPKWTIPVVIQFEAVRPYKSFVETLIRQALPELPSGLTVRNLLENGDLTVMVDDVDFTISQRWKPLMGFISEFPKCRYILASSTAFVETSALKPEIVPEVPFSRVRMRALESGQLLALIENHGTTDPLKADQLLERVLRDVSALNVPLTPVTGTFLIQIFRDTPDQTILNQAALTERYIEMLLEKYAPRELLPGTFDFRNKVDLLCAIAERMVRTGNYTVDYNEMLSWCIEYLRDYGLNFNATDLLGYFIAARILEKYHDGVRFRLRMFFEFFAATRMIDSSEFKEFVFSDDNYLCFVNEISFYTALSRRDKVELERMYQNFGALSDSIWPIDGDVQSADDLLETYEIPGSKLTEEELEQLFEQIKSKDQLEQDRKALLEGAETIDGDSSQEICRPVFESDAERWLAHLVLLSAMVKHTELIPDADKRRYLSRALQGWVQFAANSLGIVAILAKERRVTFNGITYRSTLAEDVPIGEMARRLSLSMPVASAKMAATFLGTEKLQLQLEEGLGTSSERPAKQFIRLAVLADLGIPNISG